MPPALIALAIGAFGIGLTEFVISGLLSDIATDLRVSIPTAGLLISGYALAVAIGAPILTVAGARVPRKTMLLGLMVLFIAGNLISALAPSYPVMMIGRIVAALTHGAFFGIGAVVAARLVPPGKGASAIALMFTGLTVANVGGVPLGTALGQALGWRSTFWAVTLVGVAGLIGIAVLVPTQPIEASGGLRGELAVFRRVQVWLALALTALGFGGIFAIITFFEPMMTQAAGFSSGAVPWLLILLGAGLFVGNLLGGRLADRSPVRALSVLLPLLTIALGLFTFTARAQIPAAITIPIMGALAFGMVPALQMRVMSTASEAPSLASAANIGAFNFGNFVGSWLAGLAITAGFGLTSPGAVAAALAGLGVVVLAVTVRIDRSRARRLAHSAA